MMLISHHSLELLKVEHSVSFKVVFLDHGSDLCDGHRLVQFFKGLHYVFICELLTVVRVELLENSHQAVFRKELAAVHCGRQKFAVVDFAVAVEIEFFNEIRCFFTR